MKTFMIKTLGCRLNQAESEEIRAGLEKAGYAYVARNSPADICIIHTCTVTATAENKCLQEARRMRRRNSDAFIVLAGCAVETGNDLIKRCGADLLADQHDKFRLPEIIEKKTALLSGRISNAPHSTLHAPHSPSRHRSRALLKIQTGCNFRCAYCIVPDTRGAPVSVPFETVMAQARKMIAAGYQELVITGVNTGLYKSDERDLIQLLKALADLPGTARIRISSIETTTVEDELIDLIAQTPRICSFLHAPLQSGSNNVLQAMRRRYTAESFSAFIMRAAEKIPQIGIGTDLICGFPGETDADFCATRQMVEQLPFSNLHIFPFSPRPGTPAAETALPAVPQETIRARTAELIEIGNRKRSDFAAGFTGKTVEILIEKIKKGQGFGWTAEYLPAAVPAAPADKGQLIKAQVLHSKDDQLICRRM